MKFLLKDIELHLEDEIIEQGEQLLARNQLEQLIEIEKQLWAARFMVQTKVIEVELQLKAKRIQDCTCDCDLFQKTKCCPHVVASLLAVRTKLKEKDAARKAKAAQRLAKRNTSALKLSPGHILDTISHEELKHFVKRYATSNRQFGLSLKAKFARKINLPDPLEKYRSILDSTINTHLKSRKKFTISIVRQIAKIMEMIFVQLEDALSLQELTEVFAIIQVSFEKLYPLLRRVERKNSTFLGLMVDNMNYFEELLKQEMAPSFRTQLWEFGLAEMQRSNYLSYQLSSDWYRILRQFAKEEQQLDQLLEVLASQLKEDFLSDHQHTQLLVLQLNLLEQRGDQAAIDAILETHQNKPEVLLAAVKDAWKKKDLAKAAQLAEQALEHTQVLTVRNNLEEILLQIALQKKQKKAIKDLAIKRFLATYDMAYVDLLKTHHAKTWDKIFSQLVNLVESQSYSLARRDALAGLFYLEKRPQDLMAYVQKIRSIDLLQRYDQFLIQYDKTACYLLYENLLDHYLEFHLGRKTAVKMRGVFHHLEKINATDLKRKLLKKYRKTYRERHSLIEELADF